MRGRLRTGKELMPPRRSRGGLFDKYLCTDHLLMFSSDYPHAESRVDADAKRKLFWENAAQCFGGKG